MPKPKYSVGTWDADKQAYTPQAGIRRSINISLRELRRVLKQLRRMGFSAHRCGNKEDGHDSDWTVLVERTDGEKRDAILKRWAR